MTPIRSTSWPAYIADVVARKGRAVFATGEGYGTSMGTVRALRARGLNVARLVEPPPPPGTIRWRVTQGAAR